MYKVHARVSLGASGLQAVEKVVEVMYTLQLCDEVNQCPSSLVPNWMVDPMDQESSASKSYYSGGSSY